MFPNANKKGKTGNNQRKKRGDYRAASEPPGEVAREWRLLLTASAVDLQLGRRKSSRNSAARENKKLKKFYS